MHLIAGFINVLTAALLAQFFKATGLKFFGRGAVRRCCAAYTAGAGIDEGAISTLLGMGPAGAELLETEAERLGPKSIPAFILNLLRRSKRM